MAVGLFYLQKDIRQSLEVIHMGLFKKSEDQVQKKQAELMALQLDDQIDRLKRKKEQRDLANKPKDADLPRLTA